MTYKILKKKNRDLYGKIVASEEQSYLVDKKIPVLYSKDLTAKDIEELYGIYIRDYDLIEVDLLTILK